MVSVKSLLNISGISSSKTLIPASVIPPFVATEDISLVKAYIFLIKEF